MGADDYICKPFSAREVMARIYDSALAVSDRCVDSHIKNIRKKMMQVSEEVDPVAGVYGVGYKLRLGEDEHRASSIDER